jgi:hypothetical protein
MLKTEFPFERFLEIVLPGAVFSIGLWYIHRPFLAVYFPTVASMVDSSATETASFASKATVFFCLTLVLRMALRSLADIGVAALFADESHTEKSKRWTRRLAEYVVRILLFHGAPDPRVRAVDRYLLSERKREFLEVAKDWAFHRGPLEE